MSRSRQAYQLGTHLSQVTEEQVDLRFDSGAIWLVEWTDGPLHEQMREHVVEALSGHRFPDMRDRTFRYTRHESSRAWAARAIAARRDGTLPRAVTEGAAWRRANLPHRYLPYGSDLTPEDHALLDHVQQLLDTTPYPDRPSAPEDEPLIEQLLAAAGRGAEYAMTRVLLNADRAPAAGQPPRLRSVPTRQPDAN